MVLALPSLDGYLRTALNDLIESASQASMILLRARPLRRCFLVACRSQNRPGTGNASGWRTDGALERASVRGHCLAAVILEQQQADDQAPADDEQDQAPADGGRDQAQYAPPPADPADEIEHLAQLHSSGALSDEEFTAAKAKILGT